MNPNDQNTTQPSGTAVAPQSNGNSTNSFTTNSNVSDKHLAFVNQNNSGMGGRNQSVEPSTNPTPIPSVTNFVGNSQQRPTIPQNNANNAATKPVNQQSPSPVNSSPQRRPVPVQQPGGVRVPQQNPARSPNVVRTNQTQNQNPPAQRKPENAPVQLPPVNNRPKYINPLNFQGQRNRAPVEEVQNEPTQIPVIEEPAVSYPHLENQSRNITINTYEILKLCIYIIPTLPVFLLLLRSVKDKEVMWHARQSLIGQLIWLVVLFVLNAFNAPLISGNGITLATLWNILLIGTLIYAGSQAYLGRRWAIPVIHEIGITYIEGE